MVLLHNFSFLDPEWGEGRGGDLKDVKHNNHIFYVYSYSYNSFGNF